MVKKKTMNDQSAEELKILYHDLSREIFDLSNELSMARKLDKPHLLRAKKKDRARVMTALRQKGATITH